MLSRRQLARTDDAVLLRKRKAKIARARRVALAEERRAKRRRQRKARGESVCFCDAFPFPHRKGSEGSPGSAMQQELRDIRLRGTGDVGRRRFKQTAAGIAEKKKRRAARAARSERASGVKRRGGSAWSFLPF